MTMNVAAGVFLVSTAHAAFLSKVDLRGNANFVNECPPTLWGRSSYAHVVLKSYVAPKRRSGPASNARRQTSPAHSHCGRSHDRWQRRRRLREKFAQCECEYIGLHVIGVRAK